MKIPSQVLDWNMGFIRARVPDLHGRTSSTSSGHVAILLCLLTGHARPRSHCPTVWIIAVKTELRSTTDRHYCSSGPWSMSVYLLFRFITIYNWTRPIVGPDLRRLFSTKMHSSAKVDNYTNQQFFCCTRRNPSVRWGGVARWGAEIRRHLSNFFNKDSFVVWNLFPLKHKWPIFPPRTKDVIIQKTILISRTNYTR